MAVYYLDTSALVKRYAAEIGTIWVTRLLDKDANHQVYTVRVAGPEMIAAIYRKLRTGEISSIEVARAAARFRADWGQQYLSLKSRRWLQNVRCCWPSDTACAVMMLSTWRPRLRCKVCGGQLGWLH